MDLNLDLNLVQSQKILLTPKLKQAISILQMNSQELFEYVEEQLESNPVLEILENELPSEDASDVSNNTYAKRQHLSLDFIKSEALGDEDIEDINDPIKQKAYSKGTLKDHLLIQLHTARLSDTQIAMGEYLIDNIDQNGYLTISLSEVAKFFNVHMNKVIKVLHQIQGFDPPGIAARNLKECLVIQLKQQKNIDQNILSLVMDFLDDLGNGKIEYVAKKTGLGLKQVMEYYQFIRTLEPKPGREFYNGEEVKFIIPDVIIKGGQKRVHILLNEDSIPLLNINEYYRKILISDVNQEVKRYIQGKLDHAVWLVRCIEQRKSTIFNVSEYIVKEELEFLQKGKKALKLLNVYACAQALEIHESILLSTLHGKYFQCPWGVFEMKYFFE